MTNQKTEMPELCPCCGALPIDWVENPFKPSGCEDCEKTGRIECEPDNQSHTHPCDTCQPFMLAEFNRGVAYGQSANPSQAPDTIPLELGERLKAAAEMLLAQPGYSAARHEMKQALAAFENRGKV